MGVEPRWLNPWTAALWTAWSVAALWAYFSNSHTPVFSLELWLRVFPPVWEISGRAALENALKLLKLAGFMVACAGLGRAVLRRAGLALNAPETFAFSYGIGTSFAGVLMVLLGLAQLWKAPIILGLSFAALAAAIYLNKDLFSSPHPLPDKRGEGVQIFPADLATWAMGFIVALELFLTGFYALSPELFYDSLVYHLATPDLYRLSGGMVATPNNLYNGFPMHGEMLFGWALFAGDSALAKLVHWSMGLGICASIIGLAARAGRPRAGWTACALFLATPLVGLSLFKTAVEACSAYMVLLALHALLLWVDDDEKPRSYFYLSAVFVGTAMATKYTNWPSLGVFAVILLALRAPFASVLAYCATALAFIVPWVAKNLWFYGNPIFPYFHEKIRPAAEYTAHWKSLQSDAWGRNWNELIGAGPRALFEVAAHPWFMSVRGASDADFLGPFFLLGLPTLALFKPAGRHGRVLLGLAFGLWMLWWPVTAMPRFFMPGLLLLSLWLAWTLDSLPSIWRRGLTLLAFPLLLNGAFWVALSTAQLESWDITLNAAEPASFLNRAHPTYPTPYYSAAKWINTHAPKDARVLVVGDGRSFYLERRSLAASALDDEILPQWLKMSPDADALKARLDREGITYLLVNVGELVRLRRGTGMTARDLDVLDAFLRRFARRRHEDLNQEPRDFRWQTVYEISAAPASPPEEGSPLLGWYRQQLKEAK